MADNDTKKRPRGLKKSTIVASSSSGTVPIVNSPPEEVTSAKKPRLGENEESEDETQTLILNKEVEEGDEVAEVKVIYESAAEKLATAPKSALPLLRGTIHECDRILRNHSASSPPLPASFHMTYGSALFDMGTVLEEEEDPTPYWEAARERLEIGLESVEESEAEENKSDRQEFKKGLRMALGKVMVSKATNTLITTRCLTAVHKKSVSQLLEDATAHFDKAFSLPFSPSTAPELCMAASLVQLHADNHEEEAPRLRWNGWAKGVFERALKDDPEHIPAFTGIGSCLLSIANYWLEQQDANGGDEDEDDDDDDDGDDGEEKVQTKEKRTAKEALVEGTDYFERALAASESAGATTSEILTMLAESQINLANLTSDVGGTQTALYKCAVAHLRRAKESNSSEGWALPAGLETFLDEWEAEMVEGEGVDDDEDGEE
ncbi:nuclear pore complex subunit Nro1-domain-containing protein [Jimgerdemannia flammicorona]|uniref:Nuclear pore complex subunit Nro1-domain-containing protein n=1 Tax=Jimgerdemannia flammicorona TaxID=994334 RepID=A0A433D2D4_9FUNG|nr:nuclear pore complex subunit Nro1-domain-containing protein [Jimgerdemannia flammicorona]